MRVKKVFCLLLMVACLMVQAVPVFAAEGITEADVKALPRPSAGVDLILTTDLEKDGSYQVDASGAAVLTNNTGLPVKVLVFDTKSDVLRYTQYVEFEVDEVGTVSSMSFSSSQSFTEALEAAGVIEDAESFYSLPSDAYVLFFKADAVSLSDVLYCVSTSELINYAEDPFETVKPSGTVSENSFNVTLVQKLGNAGGKFRLDYALAGCTDVLGNKKAEHLTRIVVDELSKSVSATESVEVGSLEFDLDMLQNKDYTVSIYTDCGSVYSTVFNVDFVEAFSDAPFAGSFDAPVVTFVGLPSETGVSEAVYLTVKTDIPALLTWNGSTVGADYVTESEILLYQNGDYYYTLTSEVGQVTTGVLSVTCFVDGGAPVAGSPLLMHGDSGLVQTGIESDGHFGFVGLFAVLSICALGAGVYALKRRG